MDKIELNNIKLMCKKVRREVIEMIYCAKSGHPGGSLSAVEIITTLFKECMKISPNWDKDPDFKKRDRFILSKGHASATLYAVMAECGYFPKSELNTFRHFGSRLQGHPSSRRLKGIEVSTGSLGQGLSMANGIALALKLDKNPANVIPICIVAKNLLGFSNIFFFFLAFLFPSFVIKSIFASFNDINAISLAAKKAFSNIRSIKINICPT